MRAPHTLQPFETDDSPAPRPRGGLMSSDAIRAALRTAFYKASASARAEAPADAPSTDAIGEAPLMEDAKPAAAGLRIASPTVTDDDATFADDAVDIPFVQALLDELTDEEREDAERVLNNYVAERRRRGLF